jgi:hypothetical protein
MVSTGAFSGWEMRSMDLDFPVSPDSIKIMHVVGQGFNNPEVLGDAEGGCRDECYQIRLDNR